jgi:hypothetical protein
VPTAKAAAVAVAVARQRPAASIADAGTSTGRASLPRLSVASSADGRDGVRRLTAALVMLGDASGGIAVVDVQAFDHRVVFTAADAHARDGSDGVSNRRIVAVFACDDGTDPTTQVFVSVSSNGEARQWLCRRAMTPASADTAGVAVVLLNAWSVRMVATDVGAAATVVHSAAWHHDGSLVVGYHSGHVARWAVPAAGAGLTTATLRSLYVPGLTCQHTVVMQPLAAVRPHRAPVSALVVGGWATPPPSLAGADGRSIAERGVIVSAALDGSVVVHRAALVSAAVLRAATTRGARRSVTTADTRDQLEPYFRLRFSGSSAVRLVSARLSTVGYDDDADAGASAALCVRAVVASHVVDARVPLPPAGRAGGASPRLQRGVEESGWTVDAAVDADARGGATGSPSVDATVLDTPGSAVAVASSRFFVLPTEARIWIRRGINRGPPEWLRGHRGANLKGLDLWDKAYEDANSKYADTSRVRESRPRSPAGVASDRPTSGRVIGSSRSASSLALKRKTSSARLKRSPLPTSARNLSSDGVGGYDAGGSGRAPTPLRTARSGMLARQDSAGSASGKVALPPLPHARLSPWSVRGKENNDGVDGGGSVGGISSAFAPAFGTALRAAASPDRSSVSDDDVFFGAPTRGRSRPGSSRDGTSRSPSRRSPAPLDADRGSVVRELEDAAEFLRGEGAQEQLRRMEGVDGSSSAGGDGADATVDREQQQRRSPHRARSAASHRSRRSDGGPATEGRPAPAGDSPAVATPAAVSTKAAAPSVVVVTGRRSGKKHRPPSRQQDKKGSSQPAASRSQRSTRAPKFALVPASMLLKQLPAATPIRSVEDVGERSAVGDAVRGASDGTTADDDSMTFDGMLYSSRSDDAAPPDTATTSALDDNNGELVGTRASGVSDNTSTYAVATDAVISDVPAPGAPLSSTVSSTVLVPAISTHKARRGAAAAAEDTARSSGTRSTARQKSATAYVQC